MPNLGRLTVNRVTDFLCCHMIWGHPPSHPQAREGELYIQGVERQRGVGVDIVQGKGGGVDSKHTTAQKLWHSLCNTHFTWWPIQYPVGYSKRNVIISCLRFNRYKKVRKK